MACSYKQEAKHRIVSQDVSYIWHHIEQARSQGGGATEAMLLPITKSFTETFRLIKRLMCKPNKYFCANQQNCRNLSSFSF